MSDVFLLGAGASKEYVGAKGPFFCDPDFFRVVERMWGGWFGHGVLEVLGLRIDNRPEHYDNGRWDWPQLRAILEGRAERPVTELGLEEAFSLVHGLGESEEALFCRCIELAIFHQLRGADPRNVPVHLAYFRKVLHPGATIITFNYDPVIEIALQHLSLDGLQWNPSRGYGIELHELGNTSAPGPQSNVLLLKLHGSMNWLYPADGRPEPPFRLFRLLPGSLRGQGRLVHRGGAGIMRPVFVPPAPVKRYEGYGLVGLWDKARAALRSAESVTVIGYRLPSTDHEARALLADSAAHLRETDRITYVIKDDQAAVDRFRAIFPRARVYPVPFSQFAQLSA